MNKREPELFAQKIRDEYAQKENEQLDELKKLDRKVKRPAKALAYAVGTVGSLVLGSGMCLAMGVIGNNKVPGIVIGCAGIAMVSGSYPLYKAVLKARKAAYADEILALSDKIMESHKAERKNEQE